MQRARGGSYPIDSSLIAHHVAPKSPLANSVKKKRDSIRGLVSSGDATREFALRKRSAADLVRRDLRHFVPCPASVEFEVHAHAQVYKEVLRFTDAWAEEAACGLDGSGRHFGLVQGSNGYFYGTRRGRANGYSTVFRISRGER